LRAQGQRTMSRLLDAGMKVLAERGYHAARVDDVVRAARTSHGTFYLYFSNKEDLVRALAVECADRMTALSSELGPVEHGDEGREQVRRWLQGFAETYRRYGPVIRAWMEDQVPERELADLGRAAFSDVAGSLVTRIAEASPRHVDDAELAAAALLAMVERINYFVLSRSIPLDDEAMLDTLATVVHRGFFGGSAE
jgi:AcrR family transcriptional regulator